MKYTKKLTKMGLNKFRIIFWDFDGVIKDSVDVKSWAFESLFSDYGTEISKKVRVHHEDNGGMSRFDKIPLYLKWAGLCVDEALVEKYLSKFSAIVFRGVIDAPWVPGAREYLLLNCKDSCFVLLTATPEEEIISILNQLGISHCFEEVHGSPKIKKNVVSDVLKRRNINSFEALLIGDSEVDLSAAQVNSVPFLLRRTLLNKRLQDTYLGAQFENFENE